MLRTMTSTTVKCANCNVVISELLAFLQNVLDFMDEESIHQLVTTSFSAEDIVNAKSLLYDSVPNAKKMPLRRKEGKKKMSRDLDDIIGLMKSTDPLTFPIFVAKRLHKLPPVTFDSVNVTGLLRDILCLKNQMCALEEKVVSTDEFYMLKQEVDHMRHASLIDNFSSNVFVNKKRGACLQDSYVLDSGPIGLDFVPEFVPMKISQPSAVAFAKQSALNKCDEDVPISVASMQDKATSINERVEASVEHTVVSKRVNETSYRASSQCSGSTGVSGTEAERVEATPATTAVSSEQVASATLGLTSDAPIVSPILNMTAGKPDAIDAHLEKYDHSGMSGPDLSEKCSCEGDNNSEWHVVKSKSSKRYKLIGQRGCATPDSKFRAADVKVPLLISNVCKETSVDDITSYIKSKTNETVSLKMINMKKIRKYNAYKLFVSKHKLEVFLNDQLWPSGITFRRFVHFRYAPKV